MLPRTAVTLASRSHTPRQFVYRHTDRSPHSPSSLFSLPAWRIPRGSDRPRTLVVSPSLGQGQITLQYSWEENEGQWKDFVGIGTVTLGIQNVPGLHYQIRGEGSIYVHPAAPTRFDQGRAWKRKQSCNHDGDARFASCWTPREARVWKKVAPHNQPVRSAEWPTHTKLICT